MQILSHYNVAIYLADLRIHNILWYYEIDVTWVFLVQRRPIVQCTTFINMTQDTYTKEYLLIL